MVPAAPYVPVMRNVRCTEILRAMAALLLLQCPSGTSARSGDKSWFRFTYDNDFFHATDRYFTQGIGLELSAPFIAGSPLRHVLIDLDAAMFRQYVLIARQDCFTPTSIRREMILRTDRPFAAALYATQRMISTDTGKARRLTASISLGILGPCALCAEEQIGIHRALDNITPLGWEFQVAHGAILNYSVQFEQRLLRYRYLEVSGGSGAELGTYRTNANALIRVEAGRFNPLFDGPHARSSALQVSAKLSGELRAIGYDATFQGGPRDNRSAHTLQNDALEHIVLRGEAGIRIRYRALGLSFSRTIITREVKQGLAHGWGTLEITVAF